MSTFILIPVSGIREKYQSIVDGNREMGMLHGIPNTQTDNVLLNHFRHGINTNYLHDEC